MCCEEFLGDQNGKIVRLPLLSFDLGDNVTPKAVKG